MASIWFMLIYLFLTLWLEYGLCGFFNLKNTACVLFVTVVDFYTTLFLISTFHMVLMWVHVDSISISTLKSQLIHIETKFLRRNKQTLWQKKTLSIYS